MYKYMSIAILFVGCFALASAIKCHQCNSYEQARCADPFVFEPQREGDIPKPKTNEFLKDCPNDGKNYTLCRKIYQNVRGDERIIRGCGYEEYKHECYKTVLEEYNTYVCQCNTDGCNGSSTINFSIISMALAAVLAMLLR